jgi:ATP-dependent DNA helicase DinG
LTTSTLQDILGPGGPLAHRIPNYEFRPQQLEASTEIERALVESRHAFIEAGTGVGKSLAYLIPAIRLIAAGKCVVVSTHTIGLQTQLIEKDIPLAMSLFPDVAIKPALMKGRSNYLCRRDLDAAHEDLLKVSDDGFHKLLGWVKLTGTGDRAELDFEYPQWNDLAASADSCSSRACRYFEDCFYFAMRKKAAACNLIVVNHWLFLSDLVGRQNEEKNILPKYDVVIFDEAQHLEGVARETLGFHLSSSDIHRWIDKAKGSKAGLSKTELGALLESSERLFAPFQNIDRPDFLLEEACDFPKMQEVATSVSVSIEGNVARIREAAENNTDQKQKDRLEALDEGRGPYS